MPNSLCNTRLAETEAGLSRGYIIHSWGLPKPTQPIYQDHSQKVALADGGQALRGWPSVTLIWDRLSITQFRTLRKLVEAAIDNTGYLYLTVDKSWNGSEGHGYWVDVRGKPTIPDNAPTANTSGMIRDNVVLEINNIESVNDPASF